MIGDGILFYLAENSWFTSAAIRRRTGSSSTRKTGGYDVKTEYDDRSPSRPMGKPVFRKFYRYQIQGPNAEQVIKKLNGGPFPDIKFFNMGDIKIAGRKVRALRHGMAGAPGLEVWGPVRGRRRNPRGDPRSRQGFRHRPGRRARLRDQHA